MAGLQVGCVVGFGCCDEDVSGCAVAVTEGRLGETQLVPGRVQSPADSEQLSIWPFGERQSLACELSQVPTNRGSSKRQS